MLPSLTDDAIEERYFLRGRMEILRVLNDLIHYREPVTVYFNAGRDFFQTTLLEARAETLVFDLSGDPDANQHLALSNSCVLVSHLNGIRVQFLGAHPSRFSWGGSDAFWIPLPDRLVRVQRRESYRILLPVAKPFLLKLLADDEAVLGEWPAHDLSVGGLSCVTVDNPNLKVDQEIPCIKLALPWEITIACAARIRHITQISEHLGVKRYRVGLSFMDLPSTTAVSIQRFITKIEHQRRNLEVDGLMG